MNVSEAKEAQELSEPAEPKAILFCRLHREGDELRLSRFDAIDTRLQNAHYPLFATAK